jgi:hypothetical protein
LHNPRKLVVGLIASHVDIETPRLELEAAKTAILEDIETRVVRRIVLTSARTRKTRIENV